jgi:hypothetical protein
LPLSVPFVSRAGLLFIAVAAVPVGARAWGVPGCVNLPEYNRALGALQGMTSACDMSVEEARRVIAAHDGAAAPPPATAAPPVAGRQVAPEPQARPRGRRPRARHRATRRPI